MKKKYYLNRSVAERIADFKKYTEYLKDNPEKSRKFLQSAGICDANGSFTEPYKSLEKFRVPK